jgi:hypothetical protein
MQNSINRMRHITGGAMANATSSSPVGLVNRKLSPFNVATAIMPQHLSALSTIPNDVDFTPLRSFFASPSPLNNAKVLKQVVTSAGHVQTVTTVSKNVLQAGMDIFTNSLHISTANAFMTVFLVALMFFAIILAIAVLGFAALWPFARLRKLDMKQMQTSYLSFARGWALRTVS